MMYWQTTHVTLCEERVEMSKKIHKKKVEKLVIFYSRWIAQEIN